MTMLKHTTLWRLSLAGILLGLSWPLVSESTAGPLDQLTDLPGRATVVVTLKGRDNFTSEYRYDISVRNQSPDPLIADSLVIILDKITNLAGEDRDPLKGESFLRHIPFRGPGHNSAGDQPGDQPDRHFFPNC